MAHLRPEVTVRAAPVLSDEARSAILEQRAGTPDWAPWLDLLEVALEEADRDDWLASEILFPGARPADGPLLEGARILVDPGAASRTLAALLRAAEAGEPVVLVDPVSLLAAGVRQDDDGIAALADEAGLPAPLLATVAGFLAMPVMLEAAHRATEAIPPGWRAGYCPVCAAWPTLAELRGLERRRVLRCGRCATGWARDVLHCAFCGERDHRRQGGLVPEEGGELIRIETCDRCHGYLKVATTLRPKAAWSLLLEDLRTLPLELRAVDAGYSRPDRPGWRLNAAVAARAEAR